jgi:hypothetical protein
MQQNCQNCLYEKNDLVTFEKCMTCKLTFHDENNWSSSNWKPKEKRDCNKCKEMNCNTCERGN